MSKVWFITGAGRGMGTDIAKAALAAGCKVVATGRNTDKVVQAIGPSENLLVVTLDVTNPTDVESAVKAAVDRFGRIDVLVNAGNFYAGFFEEISPEDFREQVETNLFGPMNVTRAVLPVMRAQRSGLIVQISSTAGISGQEFCSAYAASKFGLEGWIESLTPEVGPFGIRTMLVELGFFRTELLTDESTNYPEPSIDDYAEKTKQTVTAWKGMNGLQGGNPAKLAKALIQLASQDEPPLRWAAGATRLKPSSRRPSRYSPRRTPTGSFHRRSSSTRPRAPRTGARSPTRNCNVTQGFNQSDERTAQIPPAWPETAASVGVIPKSRSLGWAENALKETR